MSSQKFGKSWQASLSGHLQELAMTAAISFWVAQIIGNSMGTVLALCLLCHPLAWLPASLFVLMQVRGLENRLLYSLIHQFSGCEATLYVICSWQLWYCLLVMLQYSYRGMPTVCNGYTIHPLQQCRDHSIISSLACLSPRTHKSDCYAGIVTP